MKKLLTFAILTVVLCIIVEAKYSQAFNSGTHIYIAERVFPYCLDKIDLYYGSIAPDLDMFVTANWETPFDDTHWNYIDLRRYATNFHQRAFAKGWRTHSENYKKRGADYYAHGPQQRPPVYDYNGYVIEKATILIPEADGLILDFAHSVVETAIDLLLKYQLDPNIGEKLLYATLFRCPEDLNLLEEVLVKKAKVTDLETLASAELFFRNITARYSMALSLPHPKDVRALSKLISEIAQQNYELPVSPKEVQELLNIAITCSEEMDLLCDDYKGVISEAIQGIKLSIRE